MSVNYANIGSDNGMMPALNQVLSMSNGGLLYNGPLGRNCSDIQIKMQ